MLHHCKPREAEEGGVRHRHAQRRQAGGGQGATQGVALRVLHRRQREVLPRRRRRCRRRLHDQILEDLGEDVR